MYRDGLDCVEMRKFVLYGPYKVWCCHYAVSHQIDACNYQMELSSLAQVNVVTSVSMSI